MRTHKEIIQTAGALAVINRAGLGVTVHTVRSWQQRNGIPGEYWVALDTAGIATLSELAHAAAARRDDATRGARIAANDASAQSEAA